ncbi:MAG: phosphomannomutase/phosphoglucomutase [Anaerolineae bacterium]|nr:phosphomannomutase/phosphoglucomutase [Anaerolineae bacterium]
MTAMIAIDASLFRRYDIRGLAEGSQATLNGEVARLIGRAAGTLLRRQHNVTRVVLGHDNRLSSPALHAAARDGLLASGCQVLDIGLTPTPLLYHRVVHEGDSAGLMITGSHLPAAYNGFKLALGAQSLFGEQLQALRLLIEANNLDGGAGALRHCQGELLYAPYVADQARRIASARPLRVVVDAGNGTAGLIASDLLRALGHKLVECLYCEPDGRYPNHQPDPGDSRTLATLCAAVPRQGADVGLAFDGDADRLGVVDDRGRIVAADRVLTLLGLDLLRRHPGARLLADVSCSQVFLDSLRDGGGQPMLCATGHALVKRQMAEGKALLAGEISGHFFCAEDYFGFDDAFHAAGRLLQLLAAKDAPLAALDDAIPRPVVSPLYRPQCPPATGARLLAALRERLAGDGELLEIDGLRLQLPDAWGLARLSNTEPVISLRFEGRTEETMAACRARFAAVMDEVAGIRLEEPV